LPRDRCHPNTMEQAGLVLEEEEASKNRFKLHFE
jgi:hypothetical protein